MSSKPVALIFGVGANIGTALVNKFVGAGYRVAAVSRSAADPAAPSNDGTTLPIRADLSQASEVAPVFETIRKTWGVSPRIVIWNAARLASSPGGGMFSIPVNEFDADLAVNTTSPWVAAGEAVKGWKTGDKGVFIYTGNIMAKAIVPYPGFSTLGSSKRATTYWVTEADKVFEAEGWRFFYADERTAQGLGTGHHPGAESHAEMYIQLAESNKGLPSYVTFVNGKPHEF